MRIVYAMTQRFLWLIAKPLFLFTDIEVHDPYNVRGAIYSPRIFAANHKGVLDMVYIMSHFPFSSGIFPTFFLSDSQEFKTPMLEFFRKIRVVSLIYKIAGTVPSGRGLGVERATDVPVSFIKRGDSIFIFPEGEREFKDTLGPFFRGAAAIAIKSGVPIVPISFRPQAKEGKKKITIRFGEPFLLEKGTSYEVGTEMLKEKIKALYFTE